MSEPFELTFQPLRLKGFQGDATGQVAFVGDAAIVVIKERQNAVSGVFPRRYIDPDHEWREEV
jgi:hypothetical protein